MVTEKISPSGWLSRSLKDEEEKDLRSYLQLPAVKHTIANFVRLDEVVGPVAFPLEQEYC
jgi:hypothetical protein